MCVVAIKTDDDVTALDQFSCTLKEITRGLAKATIDFVQNDFNRHLLSICLKHGLSAVLATVITDEDFEFLINWLEEAQIDRAGAFKYEPVEGAKSNALDNHVHEDEKQERWERFMSVQTDIAAARAQAKIGTIIEVLIDEVGEPDEDGNVGADGRSKADAPEIDGTVFIRDVKDIKQGDIVKVLIEDAEDYDLFGVMV